MNEHVEFVYQKQLERVQKALEQNRMEAHIVQTAAEVVPLIERLVPAGASAANGGSVTLAECGVFEHLRSGRYTFFDRDAPGIDKEAEQRKAFSADAYFASVNAITEEGEIYEMDGAGNRVAAIVYGPKTVILVCGRNKIVPDVATARLRNAALAAPANTHRLGKSTPCATTGVCSNCKSPQRVCNNELVVKKQLNEGRIKVILVNEDLGY